MDLSSTPQAIGHALSHSGAHQSITRVTGENSRGSVHRQRSYFIPVWRGSKVPTGNDYGQSNEDHYLCLKTHNLNSADISYDRFDLGLGLCSGSPRRKLNRVLVLYVDNMEYAFQGHLFTFNSLSVIFPAVFRARTFPVVVLRQIVCLAASVPCSSKIS